MVTKRGKVISSEVVASPKSKIADIQDSVRYLSIPQANGSHDEDIRRSAATKYLQRVRKVLRGQLSGNTRQHKMLETSHVSRHLCRLVSCIVMLPIYHIPKVLYWIQIR